MTRAEFIQRLVLNAICDDFENVDQVILGGVADIGAKCGLKVDRSEIVEALRALVGAGLAKAYNLSSGAADPFLGEIDGMPPVDTPEEYFRTYFYVTGEGMRVHALDDAWWPLDDSGNLRSEWEAPQD